MGRKRAKTVWEIEMAERFKRLREAAGLSQSQLARASGIPLKTLQTWEQGNRTPLLDAAVKVADALDITMDELCGRSPRKKGGGR